MTQDEIIEMARQAGFDEHHAKFDTRIESFAKLMAEKALADHAMREVQRLGQEIEQKIGCVNHDCDQCKAQPEQEPVAWFHPHKGFYWAKPTSISAPTIADVEPLPLYTHPPKETT